MSQGLTTWLLNRLDIFLTEEQRRLPIGEVARFRVLVGATLFLFALAVLFIITGPLFSDGGPRAFVGLVSATIWALLLLLLRGQRSPQTPALIACGLLTFLIMGISVASARPDSPSPPGATPLASVLIPPLAVYLVGVRAGLGFAIVLVLHVAVLNPLALSDFGARYHPLVESRPWVNGMNDAIVMMFSWSLSALFSASREAANAEVKESERKLHTLIESTEDPVCALSVEGHLITSNSAARRLFLETTGRAPRAGDVLDEQAGPENRDEWRARLRRVSQGHVDRFEVSHVMDQRTLDLDISLHPVLDERGRARGVTLFGRDISERKRSEARLDELHRNLVEASRRAGMAEVATGVLHNVGNTLNSVNVSASLISERLRDSRIHKLSRAMDLMREYPGGPHAFFSEDPRGRQLPEYLLSVTHHLREEHTLIQEELQQLIRNMEHIKAVVNLQQEHARPLIQVEQVSMTQLIDDAIRLHATSFERLGIRILREYAELPIVWLDRHKLLQILVNLLSNARHALLAGGRDEKLLTLRMRPRDDGRLLIQVSDNGVGIDPEHAPRLFVHGFTTKKDGHGFGLHASALAAQEMDGRLSCESAGRGQGATFTLELPLRVEWETTSNPSPARGPLPIPKDPQKL